jgi:hypothetical protein
VHDGEWNHRDEHDPRSLRARPRDAKQLPDDDGKRDVRNEIREVSGGEPVRDDGVGGESTAPAIEATVPAPNAERRKEKRYPSAAEDADQGDTKRECAAEDGFADRRQRPKGALN